MRIVKLSVIILMMALTFCCCSSSDSSKAEKAEINDIWDLVDFDKEDITKVKETEINGKSMNKEVDIPIFLEHVNSFEFDKELDNAPSGFRTYSQYTAALSDNRIVEISYNNDYLNIVVNKNRKEKRWYKLKALELQKKIGTGKNDIKADPDMTIEKILDFTADEIIKVQITYSDTTQAKSIVEFIRHMDNFVIDKRIRRKPDAGNVYDDYQIELADHRSFEIMVYDEYLKITDRKGKVSWYRITKIIDLLDLEAE